MTRSSEDDGRSPWWASVVRAAVAAAIAAAAALLLEDDMPTPPANVDVDYEAPSVPDAGRAGGDRLVDRVPGADVGGSSPNVLTQTCSADASVPPPAPVPRDDDDRLPVDGSEVLENLDELAGGTD